MSIKPLTAFNFFPKYFFLLKSKYQNYLAISWYLQVGYPHWNTSVKCGIYLKRRTQTKITPPEQELKILSKNTGETGEYLIGNTGWLSRRYHIT